MIRKLLAFILGMSAFFFTACTKDTPYEPILFSKDVCHYCKMVITDQRFGAEVVTKTGKVFKFDSIECMAHYLENNPDHGARIFVQDSYNPGKMIEFQKAFFYHDPNVRSPMGKGIFASDSQDTIKQKSNASGEILKWQDILKLIGQSGLAPQFQ